MCVLSNRAARSLRAFLRPIIPPTRHKHAPTMHSRDSLLYPLMVATSAAVILSPADLLAQDEMFDLIRKIQVDDAGADAGQIDSCEFSKDGDLIIAADNHATAKVYDRATGELINQVQHRVLDNMAFATEGKVNAAGFSFDGLHFYTGINEMGLKVWDAQSFQLVHHFADGRNSDAADFSPNDTWLAVGAANEVWLYERPGYTRIHTYAHELGEVNNIDFSFDNELMVSCAGSGASGEVILLWEHQGWTDTGLPCARLVLRGVRAGTGAQSPDRILGRIS